jgi:hypothetical protein
MSKYTTELRWVIENGYDLQLNEYPIFDENYRQKLNQKIINHYYFREIGFETVGLFRFYLKQTMNEIMPYYNQLYESALLEIDPLNTINFTETLTRTKIGNDTKNFNEDTTVNSNGDSNSNSTKNTNFKDVESDTPQGMLSIGNIEGELYASYARISKNEDTTNSTAHQETTDTQKRKNDEKINREDNENYTRTEKGNRESQSELLMKYRETFLNIDMQVINELNDLFMGLY